MMEGDVYLRNRIEGMSNDELILFIYQEMLKVLNQTIYYFEKNEIENRVTAINKGIEVVHALLSILNYEAGGEIALRLRSLYLYSIKKLTAANYDRDPKMISEVMNIFRNLHAGWAEKIDNDRKKNLIPSADAVVNNFNNDQGIGLEIYG
ncbi:MAG TPA: flagellar export chaperone FliS [Candidatus Deferrimicrobium sp.]|nr:flagellar export chaperone FliS [Candidatus Deferrimicrobium sp.]